MCRTIILSKIAHQMWHDHSFSQRRNKATERAVGVKFRGDKDGEGGGGGVDKIRKGVGGRPPLPTMRGLCRRKLANSSISQFVKKSMYQM